MTKDRKEYMKAWRDSHKEHCKAYRQTHKYQAKAWYAAHKEQRKAFIKSDLNTLGQTKESIRKKSQRYLIKYGNKIPDYEIHHCCTYDDPTKFIYCSRELHRLIHSYLKQHNIDADSDHYKYIKHLLDDTVFKFNIDD